MKGKWFRRAGALCCALALTALTALPQASAQSPYVNDYLAAHPDTAAALEMFTPSYYAAAYPDVAGAVGADPDALLQHYLTYGMQEGRTPYQGATPGAPVFQPVPLEQLANLDSLKKKCSDEEFAQAYLVALGITSPIAMADLTREEQLYCVASILRDIFDSEGTYSMSADHYNDPYGYLVLHTASCAGCTRATGLCLSILGISYEHVNENQYSHQWCRVPMEDGSYWICDAYGLYCGPEPAPYLHPYLN